MSEREYLVLHWKPPSTPDEPYKKRHEVNAQTSHTEQEWEEHKDLILGLRKGKPLHEVVSTMALLGFVASESQYKYRLRKWGDRKNLKLTDNQLGHIVRKSMEKIETGKNAAVRLRGEVIPSARINAFLTKKIDKMGHWLRLLKPVADMEAQSMPSSYKTWWNDVYSYDDDNMCAQASEAPSIVDSMQISICTSNTGQGIFNILRKWWDTASGNSSTKDDALSEAELVWAETGLDILGFKTRDGAPAAQVVLHFDPQITFNRFTQREALVLDQNSLLYTFQRCLTLDSFICHSRNKFIEFLQFNEGPCHLYRREIDINDCPRGVWAIDVGNGEPYQREQCTSNGIDWETSSYGLRYLVSDISPTNRRHEMDHYCIAWCKRKPDVWHHWLAKLESEASADHVFACSHDLITLQLDGPTIFTVTLHSICWRKGGCQWSRIKQYDSPSPTNQHLEICGEEETVHMHWSRTLPLILEGDYRQVTLFAPGENMDQGRSVGCIGD